MVATLLLDTHVLLRFLGEAHKLSKEQIRAIEDAGGYGEPLGISAMSLVEIAILEAESRLRLKSRIDVLFSEIAASTAFTLLPITYAIATQAGALITLRDPADRVIVATAIVHRMRLVTSDQRIIHSQVVPVID